MGNDGLPQGDAAIVAGHLAMGQGAKAASLQSGHDEGEEQAILKAAPAQGHKLQTGLRAQTLAGGDDHLRYGEMKAPGDLLHRNPGDDVVEERGEKRPQTQLGCLLDERLYPAPLLNIRETTYLTGIRLNPRLPHLSFSLRVRGSHHLQLNGRLGLVQGGVKNPILSC